LVMSLASGPEGVAGGDDAASAIDEVFRPLLGSADRGSHAAVDEVGSLGSGGGLQVVQPRKDLGRKAGESR